jgi:flagellar protein FlaF
MRSAAQTYKNVSRQTSSPRELEASLLLQAAARLQSVHDSWSDDVASGARAKLDDALLYNRKLWSVFLTDMADANHPMPRELRQNVANIGIFVMNHTVLVMSNPRPERLGSLININREIAAGLLSRA